MSTTEAEAQAMRRLARADHRFRIVQYFVAAFVAGVFMLAAVRLFALESKLEGLLVAAERLAEDGRARVEEERRYITCLLLVPIQERSEQAQRDCFTFADLPGGLDELNFSPVRPRVTGP